MYNTTFGTSTDSWSIFGMFRVNGDIEEMSDLISNLFI